MARDCLLQDSSWGYPNLVLVRKSRQMSSLECTNNLFLVPCCVMYFSFWYKPKERVLRLALFHTSNSLAGAVSGFLAAGLAKVSDDTPKIPIGADRSS